MPSPGLLCTLLISVLLICTSGSTAEETASHTSSRGAVAVGLQYLRTECSKQQRLFTPLLAALRSQDLSAAKRAYADSRPPYEQIEVLANVFPELDRDIDARPYALEYGEDNPAFTGFHLIERDLYRDSDTAAAIPTALTLTKTVDKLCKVLEDKSAFSVPAVFEGALALAVEVPAKKISSEEETWSDLSLLIYRSNFRGIWGVMEPFLYTDVPLDLVRNAKISYAQIVAYFNELDPENGFVGINGGSGTRPYSNVTTEERAKISELGYSLVKALTAIRDIVVDEEEDAGEDEKIPAPLLKNSLYVNETAAGVSYFSGKCQEQRKLLGLLAEAIARNDLTTARSAYRVARPPYEQIEVLAGNFLTEDRDIDARPDALPLGELDPNWRGFHKLERQIFRDEDLSESAAVLDRLYASVNSLCTILKNGQEFTADMTWNGMLALVHEVPAKKISSEEETWSDLSVMIFRENAIGIYSQYLPFAKRLPEEVVRDVDAKFDDIKIFWEYVVDKYNLWDGTEFRKYSEVPVYERGTINDLFYKFARSLRAARDELLHT